MKQQKEDLKSLLKQNILKQKETIRAVANKVETTVEDANEQVQETIEDEERAD
ncbi:hypothetical protein [Metabacillus litoralis]|uniref:hypothetical protein n=1 Tax=Metabacillus litoralis TaxID=152268 RepID=UPI00203B203F|nr:hypothetical protein [Metabacillus litoralis]